MYFPMNFHRDWILSRFQVNLDTELDGPMSQLGQEVVESMYLLAAHLV